MDWARMLAYVTGTVDQELLARNEYLAAENRIIEAQLKGRLKLSDAERATLCEIGLRLGSKALADVATIARPDTILGWYRKLIARKFDGSKARGPGRPRIKREVEELIVRIASENRDWGYDRIAAAMANLGYEISDQTVGNVLRRHGPPPAPERKRTATWAAFFRTHVALLAGTDFFTAEVLTLRGLAYYVLFFIHLESRHHLRRNLGAYAAYYNDTRTHLSLDKDAPARRPIQRLGEISARPILGGLHHEYCRT
jgi:putative transposase